VSDLVMATSTELVTSNRSSTCTIELTPLLLVKEEEGEEFNTILSDDSNRNSPIVALPIRSPIVHNTL
jgi:hypothetical protein